MPLSATLRWVYRPPYSACAAAPLSGLLRPDSPSVSRGRRSRPGCNQCRAQLGYFIRSWPGTGVAHLQALVHGDGDRLRCHAGVHIHEYEAVAVRTPSLEQTTRACEQYFRHKHYVTRLRPCLLSAASATRNARAYSRVWIPAASCDGLA